MGDQEESRSRKSGERNDEAAKDRSQGIRERASDLITGLLDREGALRRGQEMVTGVTQATKEELMRIVSSEVRSFLDKMDAVDLLQQVISGLTVDVHMQIQFSRGPGTGVRSEVTRSTAEIGTRPRKDRRDHAVDQDEESTEPADDES